MKGRRFYSHGILKTWIQDRCLKCGKFLGKGRWKYCKDCSCLENLEKIKEWNKIYSERKNENNRRFYSRHPNVAHENYLAHREERLNYGRKQNHSYFLVHREDILRKQREHYQKLIHSKRKRNDMSQL